jgi:succinyl-CoA synthetase beta subunit
MGPEPLLLKAQVHGDGRKEGGGERLVTQPAELFNAIKEMFVAKIVTNESPPEGFPVSKIMLMPSPSIEREFQLSILLKLSGDIVLSAGQVGGKIYTEQPFEGCFRPFQINRLVASCGIHGVQAELFKALVEGCLRAFFHFYGLFLQIDSIGLTESGLFEVLVARMIVDDHALYRQKELTQMADPSQVGPKASSPPFLIFDCGGQIACVANGKALALSTADLVTAAGGTPAGIIDIGSENSEKHLVDGIRQAYHRGTRVVLLNLFTGLVNGEIHAKILRKECITIPMVVRIEGTNAAAARRILKGPRTMVTVDSSEEAAARAVHFGMRK